MTAPVGHGTISHGAGSAERGHRATNTHGQLGPVVWGAPEPPASPATIAGTRERGQPTGKTLMCVEAAGPGEAHKPVVPHTEPTTPTCMPHVARVVTLSRGSGPLPPTP